ncbi:unnamed protein product [Amoebophrya sp. A120]|nr:unnamed protein product [Amoebophrya sp. A120]|eukprot:GSA120T00016992001.1
MAWCVFALFDRNAWKLAVGGTFALDLLLQFICAIWAAQSSIWEFHHGAVDLLVLAAFRAVLSAGITIVSVWWWRRGMRRARSHIEQATTSDESSSSSSSADIAENVASELLICAEVPGGTTSTSSPKNTTSSSRISSSTAPSSTADDFLLENLNRPAVDALGEKRDSDGVERKKLYVNDVKAAEFAKLVLLYFLFVCCFAMSVYTGVKTVVFGDDSSNGRGTSSASPDGEEPSTLFHLFVSKTFFSDGNINSNLTQDPGFDFISDSATSTRWLSYFLGTGVFLINLEFFLLRDFIEDLTKEEGEVVKRLHPHPLFFTLDLQCHYCDVCHEKTQKPYFEAYRCRTCDFDLCPRCYRRKDNPNFKGVAFRDDEGQEKDSLTTMGYFKKCIEMCMEFWPTMLMATGSLVVCQILTLMAPNLQGQIFDAIIGKASKMITTGGAPAAAVAALSTSGTVAADHGGLLGNMLATPTSAPDQILQQEQVATSAFTSSTVAAPAAQGAFHAATDPISQKLYVDLSALQEMLDPYALFIQPVLEFVNPCDIPVVLQDDHPAIHPDVERFRTVMRWYVAVNVLSGFFNGLRSLGIELSMRSLAAITRRKVFHSLIQIDIAHFDAMHTGQLTSRLTNDVSAMVSPLSTIMNDLVSNTILLVGGIFMAFYTSWRLSILGICVVPPITFMYRRYSRWAKGINRGIWQAYGDCNAVANEAISNIRTVRAFAAEDYEIHRFDQGVNVALNYGTKNSYVGASVQAFSSYMNLFTAILILWYGGVSVINSTNNRPDSGGANGDMLTIGGLITFQLYWNMMNSAFLNLSNVFNQLIRASSAAERVFQIIDATKDKANLVKTPVPRGTAALSVTGGATTFAQQGRGGTTTGAIGGTGGGLNTGSTCATSTDLRSATSTSSFDTTTSVQQQDSNGNSITIVHGEPLLSAEDRAEMDNINLNNTHNAAQSSPAGKSDVSAAEVAAALSSSPNSGGFGTSDYELQDVVAHALPETDSTSTTAVGTLSPTSTSSSRQVSSNVVETANNSSNLLPVTTMQGEIKLENVHFKYQTRPENPVLNGLNLTLKPNTTTALVGKSGGGKSTVIHLLLKFYDVTEGKIKIDGKDLNTLNPQDVRKFVGFVAQDTQLFATSILDNLLYGLENRETITTKEVIEACKLANAHDFIMDTEDKYQTRVGEKGVMLSGGQKQRLALARCFLRKPKLLFLDEATSALLDAENEALVQEGIDRLLEQCNSTVLLIAHRLSTVMNADQIAVVNGGKIVELGNHEKLCKKGGIYAKLVQRQMKRDANVIDEQKLLDGAGNSPVGSRTTTRSKEAIVEVAPKKVVEPKKGGPAKTEIDELFESAEIDDVA